MAQTTSQCWKDLFRKSGTTREYSFEINGVFYGPEAEISHSVERNLFDDFGIGNAINSVLKLKILANSIPRGATIKRQIRLANGDEHSEWIPKGTFFASRRAKDGDVWEITAYDAMCKAEQIYIPEVDIGVWPRSMSVVVAEIAERMGVSVDPRTGINNSYALQYPAEYTMRQVLGEIAAAHGGNWVMTDDNKLLLLSLLSAPEETNNLVNNYGDAITFGGVRIIV